MHCTTHHRPSIRGRPAPCPRASRTSAALQAGGHDEDVQLRTSGAIRRAAAPKGHCDMCVLEIRHPQRDAIPYALLLAERASVDLPPAPCQAASYLTAAGGVPAAPGDTSAGRYDSVCSDRHLEPAANLEHRSCPSTVAENLPSRLGPNLASPPPRAPSTLGTLSTLSTLGPRPAQFPQLRCSAAQFARTVLACVRLPAAFGAR